MALSSFGNPGAAAMGEAPANSQTGPDIEEIETEALGFLALSGEAKIQLLPSPWPADNLPPPTASLMSVASRKGLVAAAGPDVIILAITGSVRKAFEGPATGDGNIRPFQPELKLPMPMRISQLAFSADESYLVLSAEGGGGLAVYEVQALLQGSTQPTFELSTNGQALRALAPNPTSEKGELFAVVTTDGNLMMANLKERAFVSGPNGQVLKSGVSCLSWSSKGKQLVAGLGNGTASQMTPDGSGKGEIPKPPGIDDNHHMSSITWLENNVFLVVHTPTIFDAGQAPPSIFHFVTREMPSSFTFRKTTEQAGPFGMNRSPPHHFLLRLRDFPPNLKDLLILASSASVDIGLYTRSTVPLESGKPKDEFTWTGLSDDSRRAQLPMTGDLSDTSPIGLALDLSSKEKVARPIPRDEIDESATPLPALMVLNNEGVLASWWIVYAESIRQSTIYPGLVAAGSAPESSSAPALGQQSTSSFPSVSKPAFGTPSSVGPSTGGGFGAPSGLGTRQSVWGTPSTAAPTSSVAFGNTAFGSSPAASNSTTAFGAPTFVATTTPSFGSSGFSAPKSSPWVSASTSNASFGQPAALGKPSAPFGSAAPSVGTGAPSSGGFASFATTGGFATAGATPSGSIFGVKPASNIFGGSNPNPTMNTSIPFGDISHKIDNNPAGLFGGKSSGFVLSSTFKGEESVQKEAPEAADDTKDSLFGNAFGNALGDVGKAVQPETPVSKDADMDTTDDAAKPETQVKPPSTTPASTPAPLNSAFPNSTQTVSSGLFGSTKPVTPSSNPKPVISAGFSFGNTTAEAPKPGGGFSFANSASAPSTKPSTPTAKTPMGSKSPPPPKIKKEPSPDPQIGKVGGEIPEAPLPPDPTSKSAYQAGDTSVSSTETDAPLPPDFLPKKIPESEQSGQSPPPLPFKKSVQETFSADLTPARDSPGGPEDEGVDSEFLSEEIGESDQLSDDEEGSGEDVAKDVSLTSETNQTPGFTPESSFGVRTNRISVDNPFKKPEATGSHPRVLYGEIERSVPILPPPNLQASPRSPSPVRSAIPGRMLRPETSRSVSAPGVASQILGSQSLARKPVVPAQKTFNLSLEQQREEEQRKKEARARKEAEETQALVDVEDEKLQEQLASELEATTTLDEFIAHVEHVNAPSVDSIPAQVEMVYRDINSMIDTLGLNARALKCFIKGHTEQYKDEGRHKKDLEDDDGWCLVEVEDLSAVVEKELAKDLENGRVKDVSRKLETCIDLQRDLIRLHARHEDVRKIMASQLDPDHLAISRSQPLSAEQAAQQHDLRRDFTKFQKLLSEAEEALTILKAKIVSQASSHGKSIGAVGPTVEAVMRTITKMTSMAEKRSGDIDVLEGQLRKLQLNPAASTGSRENSPFATPNRMSLRNPATTSTYGLFYTPDSIKDEHWGAQNSLMSSTSSLNRNSPPRKKMSGYSIEEKTQLRTKLARKREVTNRLRVALQKAGTNIRLMNDDE